MKRDIMVWLLGTLGVLVTMAGIIFALQGTNFYLYRVFAPRQEQARRETFEQSKAYNEGMRQELQNMAFQYAQTDDAHKAALASLILHRVADYDVDKLDPEMRQFVVDLRAARLGGSK
jgi:hypothetical protein